jgi:hypothetical protein
MRTTRGEIFLTKANNSFRKLRTSKTENKPMQPTLLFWLRAMVLFNNRRNWNQLLVGSNESNCYWNNSLSLSLVLLSAVFFVCESFQLCWFQGLWCCNCTGVNAQVQIQGGGAQAVRARPLICKKFTVKFLNWKNHWNVNFNVKSLACTSSVRPPYLQFSRVLVPAGTSKSTLHRHCIQAVRCWWTLSSTMRTGGFEL